MKRNISILLLVLAQLLNAAGINVSFSQTDIDTIVSAASILLGLAGTIHDFFRRIKSSKAAKAVFLAATATGGTPAPALDARRQLLQAAAVETSIDPDPKQPESVPEKTV